MTHWPIVLIINRLHAHMHTHTHTRGRIEKKNSKKCEPGAAVGFKLWSTDLYSDLRRV